jgi:acyl dehydratase
MVASFVTLSGDRNPIHRDAASAASTSFREPIAPGMLQLSDTITARVVVVETPPARNRVRLSTECLNAAGEPVLSGGAWVMPAVVAEAVSLPLAV